MSPGLYAFEPFRFSVDGIIPTTFILGFKIDNACKTPKTTIEPHISYFISSIFDAPFIDIPPESKVRPLPTITLGLSFPALLYSTTINLGGSSVP